MMGAVVRRLARLPELEVQAEAREALRRPVGEQHVGAGQERVAGQYTLAAGHVPERADSRHRSGRVQSQRGRRLLLSNRLERQPAVCHGRLFAVGRRWRLADRGGVHWARRAFGIAVHPQCV